MKKVKTLITLLLIISTSAFIFASSGFKHVVIQEKAENEINIKTKLQPSESMSIVITRENGEVVLIDEIKDSPRIVNKTYDFNKARVGDFILKVFIDDELIKSTIIGKDEVTFNQIYSFDIY